MAYAQKNYNEIQGINGKYRINQIGCFLTAFCNLLERFGRGVDPLTLNREFRNRGAYVDIDDGIRDDLGWGSIAVYDPKIVVRRSANNGSVPSNNCIVRIKANNRFGTHFCLVHHIDGSGIYIVDSWDGGIKNVNAYGPVTGWAEYADVRPQPVQPIAPPPPAPSPPPVDPNIITVVVQAGWGISHVAKAAGYPNFGEGPVWDRIAQANGHANSSTFRLHPGQQVKVPKYVAPASPATPAPEPPKPAPVVENKPEPAKPKEDGEKIPVTVTPTDPKAYQKTFKSDRRDYVAIKNTTIKDFEGLQVALEMKEGQVVHSAGTFEKDGKKYHLTEKSHTNQWWYGIPDDVLESKEDNELFKVPLDLSQEAKEALNHLSFRDKLVGFVGGVQGFWHRFLQLVHVKKSK